MVLLSLKSPTIFQVEISILTSCPWPCIFPKYFALNSLQDTQISLMLSGKKSWWRSVIMGCLSENTYLDFYVILLVVSFVTKTLAKDCT